MYSYCTALSPDGGIGRRAGLKHQWSNIRAGSTPALGTEKRILVLRVLFFYSVHFRIVPLCVGVL